MRLVSVLPRGLAAVLATAAASGCLAEEWIADAQGCKLLNPRPMSNTSVQWSGGCLDGLAEGRGQLRWLVDGKPTVTYDGEMKAGRYSGQGVLATSTGSRYEGEFAEGRYAGRGKLSSASGLTQQGEFVAGRIEGACTLTWPKGDQYEGRCKLGVADGEGLVRFSNRDVYAGAFRYGLPSGPGEYRWAGGDVYQGDFRNGKPSGSGDYRFADGSRYSGNFADGLPSGRGRAELPDGLGYEGNFEAGNPTTPGAFFKTGAAAPEDSLQLRMQLALRYAQVSELPVARRLASPETLCRAMPSPQLPVVNWKGEALYRVVGTIRGGRVVSIEVAPLRAGVDPLAQRAFVSSIEQALRTYNCPGDHVFEQEFQFMLK